MSTNSRILVAILWSQLAACAAARTVVAVAPNPLVLVGTWKVDLRSKPDAAAYSQPFVVQAVDVEKRSISGSFYNSEISWSRINTAWGKLVVTFITSDGEGEYIHTATLTGDALVGTSTAKHRNMLVPWTAAREDDLGH